MHKDDALKLLKTEELEQELERRRAEAEALRLLRLRARQDALTWPVAVALAPPHGRTTCSDDNLSNGSMNAGNPPRCERCGILRAASGNALDGWTVVLRLERA